MDLREQRRSSNIENPPGPNERRWEMLKWLLSRPEKSQMSESVENYVKQQERLRLENQATALRERARDMSSLGGLVAKVPTPRRFQSSVVGEELPRDMELQLLAAEALRAARAK